MPTRLNALHDTNPSIPKGPVSINHQSINPTLCPKSSAGGLASAQYFDEKGFCPITYLIQDSNVFVTADARAMLEDAGVILFIKDASTNKSGLNTSSSMEVSAASSMTNEEFDLHDMRVPTNLPKDAPKLDKGN
jgi:hypothetical protein